MTWTLNIDLRGGRAVKRATRGLLGNSAVLSAAQSRAIGPLSAQLQSDLGIVQAQPERLPRVASEEWWRWPALGR